jgi:hypothetical protein
LIEFGHLVLEKNILIKFQCIFTLLLLSPLGEGLYPSFEQFRIPPPSKDDLCQVCLNWPSDSGEVENVKVYRPIDGQTTSDQVS